MKILILTVVTLMSSLVNAFPQDTINCFYEDFSNPKNVWQYPADKKYKDVKYNNGNMLLPGNVICRFPANYDYDFRKFIHLREIEVKIKGNTKDSSYFGLNIDLEHQYSTYNSKFYDYFFYLNNNGFVKITQYNSTSNTPFKTLVIKKVSKANLNDYNVFKAQISFGSISFYLNGSFVYSHKIGNFYNRITPGLYSPDKGQLCALWARDIFYLDPEEISDNDFKLAIEAKGWENPLFTSTIKNLNVPRLPIMDIKSGKWGYVNKAAQVKIPFIYTVASEFENQLGLVKLNDKNYFIDQSGKVKIDASNYKFAQKFYKGYAVVENDQKKFGFIDTTGKCVTGFIYDYADGFDKKVNLAEVKQNNKYGYINLNFELAIPLKYKLVSYFDDNKLAQVQNSEGKYGYIDPQGKEVIPLMYDDASSGYQHSVGDPAWPVNTLMVKKSGHKIYLNFKGECVKDCDVADNVALSNIALGQDTMSIGKYLVTLNPVWKNIWKQAFSRYGTSLGDAASLAITDDDIGSDEFLKVTPLAGKKYGLKQVQVLFNKYPGAGSSLNSVSKSILSGWLAQEYSLSGYNDRSRINEELQKLKYNQEELTVNGKNAILIYSDFQVNHSGSFRIGLIQPSGDSGFITEEIKLILSTGPYLNSKSTNIFNSQEDRAAMINFLKSQMITLRLNNM